MSRRRRNLSPPSEAKTEGLRRLRELLVTKTFAALARRLRCDEGTIRHYERGVRFPDTRMRRRMREEFGISENAWFPAGIIGADHDAYMGDEPATARKPDSVRIPSRRRGAKQ